MPQLLWVLAVIDQPPLPLPHRRLCSIDRHQRVHRLNRLKLLILDEQIQLVIGGPLSLVRARTALLDLDHSRTNFPSFLQVIHQQTYHSSRTVQAHQTDGRKVSSNRLPRFRTLPRFLVSLLLGGEKRRLIKQKKRISSNGCNRSARMRILRSYTEILSKLVKGECISVYHFSFFYHILPVPLVVCTLPTRLAPISAWPSSRWTWRSNPRRTLSLMKSSLCGHLVTQISSTTSTRSCIRTISGLLWSTWRVDH